MKTLHVLIPVHNGMPYLKECIENLLCFQMADVSISIIVSENHSTDGTAQYLSSILDERLLVINPPIYLGAGENFNFVSTFSDADFVKLICADDLITPSLLKTQVQALQSKKFDLVYSPRKILRQDIKLKSRTHSESATSSIDEISGVKIYRRSLSYGRNLIGEPGAILFLGPIFQRGLPWRSELPYVLDLDFYGKIFPISRVGKVNKLGFYFRVHNNSLSSKLQNHQRRQFISLFREQKNRDGGFRWYSEIRLQALLLILYILRKIYINSPLVKR